MRREANRNNLNKSYDKARSKNIQRRFPESSCSIRRAVWCKHFIRYYRFDVNGLSAKMKAEKGEKIVRATKDDFKVGDIVGINHKKVNPNDEFEIIKINNKNIKVKAINVGAGKLVVD
jgi:hypothetical protein